jgi:hypothetical protein
LLATLAVFVLFPYRTATTPAWLALACHAGACAELLAACVAWLALHMA